ncbi:MAG: type II toxin-antitoxin system YoeB family toxin [Chloroflexi bacterium]|nr:type II toxin-antitoxin system YoeB family toxin [Chloroflexota bacterium]
MVNDEFTIHHYSSWSRGAGCAAARARPAAARPGGSEHRHPGRSRREAAPARRAPRPRTASRRITQEHRLVYRVAGRQIHFLQARYHYEE